MLPQRAKSDHDGFMIVHKENLIHKGQRGKGERRLILEVITAVKTTFIFSLCTFKLCLGKILKCIIGSKRKS